MAGLITFCFVYLLPLDCGGRFGTDVVDNTVDSPDVVNDAVGYTRQEFIGQMAPVCRHAVGRFDSPQRHYIFISAFIPHDAHALYRQQHHSRLPYFVIQAVFLQHGDEDVVRFLQ